MSESTLVIFRTPLFRDIFLSVLSVWSKPRDLAFEQALEQSAQTAEAETLIVETRLVKDEDAREIFPRLLEMGSEERRVYLVDLEQDQIAEYYRRRHTTLAALTRGGPNA